MLMETPGQLRTITRLIGDWLVFCIYLCFFSQCISQPRYKSTNISMLPRSSTSATLFSCLVELLRLLITKRQLVDSTLKRANGPMPAVSWLVGLDTMQFTTGSMCSLLAEAENTIPRSARLQTSKSLVPANHQCWSITFSTPSCSLSMKVIVNNWTKHLTA